MTDYIETDDVKAALNIVSDETRNAAIALAVTAASKMIDNETGRTFGLDATATARVYTPCTFEQVLVTDDIGSTSGIIVQRGDYTNTWWETYDATLYEVNPLNALIKGRPITGFTAPAGWTRSPLVRIKVTAKWGWPSIPDEVKQATLLQSIRLFKRKDSPEGVLGSTDFGFTRVSRVDPDVQALISHLTLPGF